MKIGIVIPIYNIDYFDPTGPNPGIGGSQYMGLVLASLLARDYEIVLFTDKPFAMPGVEVRPMDAVSGLDSQDLLIFAATGFNEQIEGSPARLIAWAHNTKDKNLDRLADRAEQIVVLSIPQYDLLRWHKGARKMRVIPYPFDPGMFPYSEKCEDYIVYLGALVWSKGFHHYARFAEQFLKGRDTVLYVVGATQTYGKAGSGRLGVAASEYEEVFWPSIAPYVSSGQVQFKGNMGIERFPFMARAKLGLTNPTGSSETFCISNYELMSMGVPVMGGYHRGMTETLFPDERLLIHRVKQIPEKIKHLLDHPLQLKQLRSRVREHVERKADQERVVRLWEEVIHGRPIPAYPLSYPYWIDYKIPSYIASKILPRMTIGGVDAVAQRVLNFSRSRRR